MKRLASFWRASSKARIRLAFILAAVAFTAFFASDANAQTKTIVSATVLDPNGVPYAGGSVATQLVPTSGTPTINKVPVNVQNNPAAIDANGHFTISLWCNTAGGACTPLDQTGTQWQFTITNPGAQPPVGFGGVSFTVSVTITGTTQDISSALNAVAVPLYRDSAAVGGITGSGTSPDQACFTATHAIGNCAVQISGTPAIGNVPIATSASTAVWGPLSIAPVFNVQCVSNLATDTAAIRAALTSAGAVGGTAFIEHGNCLFDNSAGAFALTGFNGTFAGEGKASSIAFSTLANDGIDFNSATNLTIEDLSFAFTPATTTRGGGYPINIDASSNVLLLNNYSNNGNLSGWRIGNSNNVQVIRNTVTNFLANGFFTLNNNDLTFVGTVSANNGDAAEEYSFYDTGTQTSCQRISSTGLKSTNDVSGVLINSCVGVSVSDFAIHNSAHEGLSVIQDPATTTAHFPDQVQISNGTIDGAGYGTNPLNVATAQGIEININGAPATTQTITITGVALKHIGGRGLELGDSNTVNLTTSGLRIVDAGNGSTSATGECIFTDGNVVKMTGTYAEKCGTYALRNHLTTYGEYLDFTSVNPNQLGAATNGILNEANADYWVMKNVTRIDTFAGSSRSGISNTATTGIQSIAALTSICTVACTAPSMSNGSAIDFDGFINLPTTTAFNGYITQNGLRFLHSFGGPTELFIGSNAGDFSVTGVNNVGLGDGALGSVTSGNKNTCVGAFGCNAIVSGTQNTGVGNSVYNLGTGSSNTVMGAGGLSAIAAGNNNTCVGAFCLSTQSSGGPNTCIGENCLAGVTTGSDNIGVGLNAGNVFTTATKTISIGDSVNSAGTNNLNQSVAIGFGAQNALSNEIRLGTASEFQDFVGTAGVELTATASLTAGQVVKLDTANASSVVVAATTDITGGIAIGIVNNSPGAAGVAMVAQSGIRTAALGTGTCTVGQFVIVDTTTAGRVKCTGTYAAGTVIGTAVTAQASVGSTLSVLINLR